MHITVGAARIWLLAKRVHIWSPPSVSTQTQISASSHHLISMVNSYSLIRLMIRSWRASAQTAIRSLPSNGRLLAGGAGGGTVQVFEFDTLRLLYRVKSSNVYIKQIAFSRDSLRFSDTRESHCNVWEPAVLLRDSLGDSSSEGTTTSVVDVVSSDTKARISAMALRPEGAAVFCGKDDGALFSTNDK
jgi:hypothetical protein